MASIWRYRVTWTGMPGSPGVSTFYFNALPGPTEAGAIKTFFTTCATSLPNTLTLGFESTSDELSDADGELLGTGNVGTITPLNGSSASGYPAPAGLAVSWLTNSVAGGHRVRGRTFLVPICNQYEANGTLISTYLATVTGAAATLVIAIGGKFVVWHRPKFGPKPDKTTPRPLLATGSSHLVTASSVPDKVAVLRSRRD